MIPYPSFEGIPASRPHTGLGQSQAYIEVNIECGIENASQELKVVQADS